MKSAYIKYGSKKILEQVKGYLGGKTNWDPNYVYKYVNLEKSSEENIQHSKIKDHLSLISLLKNGPMVDPWYKHCKYNARQPQQFNVSW